MKLLIALLLPTAFFAAGPNENTLMSLDEQFCRDFAAKGVEGWLSYFAEDAIVFPRQGPIRHGMDAARQHYRQTLGGMKGWLRWKTEGVFVSKGGDLGYTYGVWESEVAGADGKTVRSTGKYFTTWRKQADGDWKIVADIGQPDAPQP